MKSKTDSYCVVAQASPDEILGVSKPDDLNLIDLIQWPSIQDVMVLMPELKGCREAENKLTSWGFRSFVGDTYNVCSRIVDAHKNFTNQEFAVRVLVIWKHIDLEYVDSLVSQMRRINCDLVVAPMDFDITMAADVASLNALERIGAMSGNSQELSRAKFNPWGYMEMHPEIFQVEHLEPAPKYSDEKCKKILSQQRCHPENEFFGRDYSGSRYHFIVEHISPGLRILDIACGSGFGSELLSRKAAFVLGVDYLKPYIKKARERYPGNDTLQFMVGDGQKFLYLDKCEQFDLVVSLHTLEHVPDDRAMLSSLYNNLRPGGQLIIEVPLQCSRPLGIPINPYHLREYNKEQIICLAKEAGFQITKLVGSNRS
ncbi:MAG TPA: methyltransferase domain-containing protein, partial [Actinobacteria bacterium]|nr:methyltransferase domain-containing protein [Actinomycetota bacterium]